MDKGRRFLTCIFLLIIFIKPAVFPMGSRQLIPMKINPVINIPDGELLHYGYYFGGEKNSDRYYVTEKITNGGKTLYRIYLDIIPFSGSKKLSDKYEEWPVSFTYDPALGSVIESTGDLKPDSEEKGSRGRSWHYKLNMDKGVVEETFQSVEKGKTNTARYIVRFNTSIPSIDMWGQIYMQRFLDVRKGGIYYSVVPQGMKSPVPFSWKFLSSENIQTKAGNFRVERYDFIAADPFMGKLLEAYLKSAIYQVEESNRHLTVRAGLAGGEIVLEGISNVKKQ